MRPKPSISDAEWAEAIGRFQILRTQRLSATAIAELSERCMEVATSSRDLAFEMGARETTPPLQEESDLPALRKRFDRAWRRIGAAEQSRIVFQRLAVWDVDESLRSVAQWLVGGSHLRLDARRENARDIWDLGVLFRKLADELRWESRMFAAAALRNRRSARAGKPPRIEAIVLLEWAVAHGVGVREVARRLVAAGVLPDANDEDASSDPVERWEGQLKAIRRRRRQR